MVGCRALAVFDPVQGVAITTRVLYPTEAPARAERFGPYALELAVDAPQLARNRVVVISHGNGGTPWSHRALATYLVRAGFAVVMLDHPGNCRLDNSLGSPTGRVKAIVLEHRPRHVRLAVDAALAALELEPDYAIVGESLGAYTALAVAGGHPRTFPDEVADPRTADPSLSVAVAASADPRVRAAVLLAPAIDFFLADGALADVAIPLLVRTGARDPLCPTERVLAALRSLPVPPSQLEVPDAGHFSFQTPYPDELAAIPPALDPPGFKRAGYQAVLHGDVATFLQRT